MLDLESARLVVTQREQARIDALVADEAARQEHVRMMNANSSAMMVGSEHAKAERVARYEEARAASGVAFHALKPLVAERERCQSRLGFSRGDLEAAEKNRVRCIEPDPKLYPPQNEIDAWRQRYGQLSEECHRIAARIGNEQVELDLARARETECLDRFRACQRIEENRRNEL